MHKMSGLFSFILRNASSVPSTAWLTIMAFIFGSSASPVMTPTVVSNSSVKLSGYIARVTLSDPYFFWNASAPRLSSSDCENEPVTIPIRKSSPSSAGASSLAGASGVFVTASAAASSWPSPAKDTGFCELPQAVMESINTTATAKHTVFFITSSLMCLLFMSCSFQHILPHCPYPWQIHPCNCLPAVP